MTQQQLNTLRHIAKAAYVTDQDIGLSVEVLEALLDEIADLRKMADEWERRARALESICSDRL